MSSSWRRTSRISDQPWLGGAAARRVCSHAEWSEAAASTDYVPPVARRVPATEPGSPFAVSSSKGKSSTAAVKIFGYFVGYLDVRSNWVTKCVMMNLCLRNRVNLEMLVVSC